ncbi:PREDICTED: basal body-orientation factor 1 isoform X4 [Chinchilla lanigera]|uniref:basal body-orientation factor 1 isoform X4 n=1 Tax=Chinchilla lanigera TaxID=34839 RepID=UPI0006985154|nr:PREDICTED: basal body-orientation factor 1 isoform X4 [Chinchilla lanigera]
MPPKGKDKRKGKSKGKDPKKSGKTDESVSVVEQAKANATLWESRLEVTELSRIEYRDMSRRLAKSNEDLKKQQYKMEKDTMSVLSYMKRQEQDKDNVIEKLKQQLVETKEKAQEEKEKLLKENLRVTEKKHQETLRRMEGRFFEEKHRLEQEAEKKIIMLAEKAHHEAVVQLNAVGRNVFKENVYLQKALAYHLKEADALQKTSQNLKDSHASLLHQKETNELLIKEKIMQLTQQRTQIHILRKKVIDLENALSFMAREFETEVLKVKQQAVIENQAGQVEIDKLQQLLQMKDREMNRVKKLAKNILDERTEVESFFLDALHEVKQQILVSRKHYKQIAQAAFNLKMRTACAGKTQYPQIRTFDGREHSTNSVNQDLMEAEKWTSTQKNVDIGDLTWEQKEKVLRLLFAKMNGFVPRNKSKLQDQTDEVVPQDQTDESKLQDQTDESKLRDQTDEVELQDQTDESKLQDQTFITQQVPISDSEKSLPSILTGSQESNMVQAEPLCCS